MSRPPDHPLWRFSLAVYERPGVAESCLALQDRHGLDVNLLLYGCWAGSCGRRLERSETARLVEAVGAWQEEVVKPLRRARRHLKACPGGGAESLRQEIKALELEAERLEQDRLFEACGMPAGKPDPAAAAQNLLHYLGCREIAPSREDISALSILLSAAFGLAPSAAERLLAEH